MNPLYSIQKELYAAWLEATHPLFPASSENDYFNTELFEYYRSRKDKIIDTKSGESLFSAITASAYSVNSITKTQNRNLSGSSSPAGFKQEIGSPLESPKKIRIPHESRIRISNKLQVLSTTIF